MKVGAAVVAARRGGLSSTFDELNKFLQYLVCQWLQDSIGTVFMAEK